MVFRRKASEPEPARFPGQLRATDGDAVVRRLEHLACDAMVIHDPGGHERDRLAGESRVAERVADVYREESLDRALSTVVGLAATGVRSALIAADLADRLDTLPTVVARRVPIVLQLASRARRRQAGGFAGGHDALHAAGQAGCFQFFSKNVQEAADLTLIARRVAELSLTPGICGQDYYETAYAVQTIRMPEPELVEKFIGSSDDTIDAPTPAQRLLLGPERRRVPRWLDPDRPVGLGGTQDADSYWRGVAGQDPYFASHIAEIIEASMTAYGELTGRPYAPIDAYRVDDAEWVVIAQGAVTESLAEVVDGLRSKRFKAGVINIRVAHPFPGAPLSHLVQGMKGVTVLDRTDRALVDDAPLMGLVRTALDRATENGRSKQDTPPYPSYATYARDGERPPLYSGSYAVGGRLPKAGELTAVFRNMEAGNGGRRRFYVGLDFASTSRRLPVLETMQQALNKAYPDVAGLGLPAVEPPAIASPGGWSLELHSLSMQGGMFAANLFAETLAEITQGRVRTFPDGGLDDNLNPTCIGIWHGDGEKTPRGCPPTHDGALVSGESLVETLPTRVALRRGANLIVETHRSPADFWPTLSRRVSGWIRSLDLRVTLLDARRVASEAASRPTFVDQLAIWAQLGTALRMIAELGPEQAEAFTDGLRKRLTGKLGEDHPLAADVLNSLRGGYTGATTTDVVPDDAERAETETDAPWTVQDETEGDGTVFDAGRFWRSVGFLHERGRSDEALTDPFVATGAMPAGSSAFRDMTAYRLRLPEWLPENCTGCGLCWAHCPDSALPPTVQPAAAVLETAMARAASLGPPFIQLTRLTDHLAKQAHRLAARDDRRTYRTADTLFQDAFEALVAKLDLDDDKRSAIESEFSRVADMMAGVPVCRTERFFAGPEGETKGSGALLTIALNPMTCKGCGQCEAVCPDGAMTWMAPDPDRIAAARHAWRFAMALPETTPDRIAHHVACDGLDGALHRMLDRRVYHALVGGDAAPPGSGVKTAVHLVSAAVDSVMRDRFDNLARRLSELIEGLQSKIQDKVSEKIAINDFEDFSKRIARLERGGRSNTSLAELLGDAGDVGEVDAQRLRRLTALHGELTSQHESYVREPGRTRLLMTIDPATSFTWLGLYPDNPSPYPWLSLQTGQAEGVADGVMAGLLGRIATEVAACRKAELELDDAYDPDTHDAFFATFGADDFTVEEWERVPPLLVLCEADGARHYDVTRWLARRAPIFAVVINHDAAPGLAPAPGGANQQGRQTEDLALRATEPARGFVCQSSIGHPGHLMDGVTRAVTAGGGAMIHVYAPDPGSSGTAPERIPELAAMAVRSRAFPLFVADPRGDGVSIAGNPAPDEDWNAYRYVVRDAGGPESTVTGRLTPADWAAAQTRFQAHFTPMSRGHRSDKTCLVDDYLGVPGATPEDKMPYVDLLDDAGRHFIAAVSPDVVAFADACARQWNYLRDRMGAEATRDRPRSESDEPRTETGEKTAPPSPTARTNETLVREVADRLLELSGYRDDPAYFERSLREFIEGGDSRESGSETP